jgi:hypothetical protein
MVPDVAIFDLIRSRICDGRGVGGIYKRIC